MKAIKIETFSPASLTQFQKELSEASRVLAAKYGINLKSNNATYSQKEVSFKIVFRADGVDQTEVTRAEAWGYPKIGKKIKFNGKEYEVTGWNFKSKKYPIIAKDLSTGKSVAMSTNPFDAIKK